MKINKTFLEFIGGYKQAKGFVIMSKCSFNFRAKNQVILMDDGTYVLNLLDGMYAVNPNYEAFKCLSLYCGKTPELLCAINTKPLPECECAKIRQAFEPVLKVHWYHKLLGKGNFKVHTL